MVRKQLYISAEQDRKLKRLASSRKLTEAELVREAIDGLPDDADPVLARLRAAGLLAPKPPLTAEMRRALDGRGSGTVGAGRGFGRHQMCVMQPGDYSSGTWSANI